MLEELMKLCYSAGKLDGVMGEEHSAQEWWIAYGQHRHDEYKEAAAKNEIEFLSARIQEIHEMTDQVTEIRDMLRDART